MEAAIKAANAASSEAPFFLFNNDSLFTYLPCLEDFLQKWSFFLQNSYFEGGFIILSFNAGE